MIRLVYDLSIKLLLTTVIVVSYTASNAAVQGVLFSPQSRYTLCFTPGDNCTQMIVQALDQAKSEVYVQAYSFTSTPIAEALIRTKERGVNVYVLLDKSNMHGRYSVIQALNQHKIPYLIDEKPAIAHNKVMIIDGSRVITGSFNFTNNAQSRNAENAIIIDDKNLAYYYLHNFKTRQSQSVPMEDVRRKHSFRHGRKA
jgi:phospholipase D